MGIASAIETAALVGGTGLSIFSRVESEKQREQALNLRLEQEKALTNQRMLTQEKQASNVFSQQVVHQAASGFTLSSPSFGAIQKDSFNELTKDLNADQLNFMFQKTSIDQAKDNLREETWVGAGESLFNAGTAAFSGSLFGGAAASKAAKATGQFALPSSSAPNTSLGVLSEAASKTPRLYQDPFAQQIEEQFDSLTNPFG